MKSEPNRTKLRWQLYLLGLFKIPIIGHIKPKLLEINEDVVKVKIKLRRRTKNHLNSMYFGSLAIGADIAGGIHTFYFSEKNSVKFSFSFKSMKAEFLKRAESDVTFICEEGATIQKMINASIGSGERQNETVTVKAYNETNEIVALFEMGVSIKVK